MTKIIFAALAASAVALSACSQSSTSSSGASDIQPYEILDRTAYIFEIYAQNMKEQGVEEMTDESFSEVSEILNFAYNSEPAVAKMPIGISSKDDGSFVGFSDANRDNKQDTGEKKLFDLEYDQPNTRLVLTDYTGESSGYRVSGGGLLAGYLLGSMMRRSTAAGKSPSRFANTKSAKPSRRAATKTRTGGSRAGK